MSKGEEHRRVEIYLVRHAQTSGNVDMKILEGKTDILTNLGQIQTNLLGMHLAPVKFDYVYSSDYGRAVKTAEGIINNSKASNMVSIQTDTRLRETDFGIYEARPYGEILTYCRSINKNPLYWEFPEGEKFPEVGQRMLSFVEGVCQSILGYGKKPFATVLIVSHSAALINFFNALYETKSHEISGWNHNKDLKLMGNASYMKLEVSARPVPDIKKDSAGSLNEQPINSFMFKFVEKHASDHLQCIKHLEKNSNGLATFAGKSGKEYIGCVQQ